MNEIAPVPSAPVNWLSSVPPVRLMGAADPTALATVACTKPPPTLTPLKLFAAVKTAVSAPDFVSVPPPMAAPPKV